MLRNFSSWISMFFFKHLLDKITYEINCFINCFSKSLGCNTKNIFCYSNSLLKCKRENILNGKISRIRVGVIEKIFFSKLKTNTCGRPVLGCSSEAGGEDGAGHRQGGAGVGREAGGHGGHTDHEADHHHGQASRQRHLTGTAAAASYLITVCVQKTIKLGNYE